MARFELQPAGRVQFRKASRQAVKDHFVSVPARERRQKWIRKNNRYRLDSVDRYRTDLDATTVDHEKMVAYVAASGPAHVVDGWSFFGRAIQALLRRDAYAAIHFGYYAELRGAMALLASEGIGVLSDRHPVVLASNRTDKLHQCRIKNSNQTRYARTHAVIVPSLLYWSTLRRAADLLDVIVKPNGIALSDWLRGCAVGLSTQAVAKSWLNTWGLDLIQIETDHDARNLASYRPSEFRLTSALDIEELGRFVRDLWELFEPAPTLNFPNLEAHLLRLAIRSAGVPPPAAATIQALGMTAPEAARWATQLAAANSPSPLEQARQTSPIESDRCAVGTISRAALLLYISTRAAGLHLSDAGYSRDDLSFWWRRFGTDRGLWDDVATPADPHDAWADVRDRLDEIELTLATPPAGFHDWRRLMGLSIDQLGAWELVAIWGLVP